MMAAWLELVAVICRYWGVFILSVAGLGSFQIQRHYSRTRNESPNGADAPHVTVIRPAKGLDPQLYECLASTFRQTYPTEKLTFYFCVASKDDAALPVLKRLLCDFPGFNAHVMVEEEDPLLREGATGTRRLGPNPKIRSMSRAYREAKDGVIWIIDCNVWVAKGVCGRMVHTLLGSGPSKRPQKLVHQLPLVIDTEDASAATSSTQATQIRTLDRSVLETKGGRLEEMFTSTSHGKFYTAINTVLVAPCLVGKSNMFRKSHLDTLTEGRGIDFFSDNICEDHLIGDLLWKRRVPQHLLEASGHKRWGNHAMLFGDLVIQPMANMRVAEYVARRVRWLRVRKYTVPAATLVEPTTESFVCAAMLSYGFTSLPSTENSLLSPHTWSAFALVWLTIVSLWALTDWLLYRKIHSMVSVEQDEHTPSFARPSQNHGARRSFPEWLTAWISREALAFPIWFWAIFGGATVTWRGKRFWVGMDMRVHEVRTSKVDAISVLDRRKADKMS